MLKTKIIASSITNLTDARYFAAWGVEGIGFDLNVNSPNFVSPAQVHAFKDWISGPLTIGQFDGLQRQEEVNELIKSLDLDAVQLSPFAPLDWIFDVPVYREVLLNGSESLPEGDHFILKSDSAYSDLDMKTLAAICASKSCFIDFILSPKEHDLLLSTMSFSGYILRGGAEEKVGFKSFDQIDEIMEILEIED